MSILCGFNDKKETKFIDDDHIKDETIYCFDCKGKLISKKGDVRKHHFSHSIESDCMGESWEHKYSKEFIGRNINKIRLVERCGRCSKKETEYFKNCYVILEHGYKGYVVDCAVFNEDGIFFCAIEICHTHKTDQEKIDTLTSNGIAFYELSTDSIIKNKNNFVFDSIFNNKSDTSGIICNTCIEREEQEEQEEQETKKRKSVVMCKRYCYTCKKIYKIENRIGMHIKCCNKCKINI
jgi:hypothetical protein